MGWFVFGSIGLIAGYALARILWRSSLNAATDKTLELCGMLSDERLRRLRAERLCQNLGRQVGFAPASASAEAMALKVEEALLAQLPLGFDPVVKVTELKHEGDGGFVLEASVRLRRAQPLDELN